MKRLSAVIAIVLCVTVLLFIIPVLAYTGNGGTIVYITQTGGRYHDGDCGSLWSSRISIKLEDAIIDGYTRCVKCNPPIYTGTAQPGTPRKVNQGGDSKITKPSTSDGIVTSTHSDIPSNNSSNISKQFFLVVIVYIPLGLILCFIVSILCTRLFKKTNLYRNILLRRRKKQLYNDVSELLSRYQNHMQFRSSPRYKALCIQHKEKSAKLKMLLSSHECEFSEKGSLRNINAKFDYGEDFTAYFGSKCYHSRNCQHAHKGYFHILDRSNGMKPCSKCHPPTRKTWMRECIRLRKEIIELEYVIYFPLTADHDHTQTHLSILRKLCKIQEILHHQLSRKPR